MSQARVLADLVATGGELADGAIAVAEVSGAAPLASPTFTGTLSAPTINASTSLQIGGTAITASAADINGVAGVNSNVQTQLNTKAPLASPTFTGTATIPTATVTTFTLGGTSVTGIGTSANNLVQLNGSSKLPAVDGSLLTGISAGTSVGKSYYLATAI
tara:strand:+ start:3348 stop:3827 length:480 start_codon:yes stop_codon:yes gene_type:complete